jgi:sulfate transport system permease protein
MKPKKKGWDAWILISVVVVYMGILIIAPITALIKGTFQNGVSAIWQSITSTALLESLILSLKIALLVVLVQVIFGSLTA